MKTKQVLLIALFAACMVPAISHAADGEKKKKAPPAPEKIFQKIDTDKSGAISKEEAEASKNKGIAKKFDKLDTNEDGELSLNEFKADKKKKSGKKKKAAKAEDDDDGDE